MKVLLKNKITLSIILLLIVVWLIYRSFTNSVVPSSGDSALIIGQDLLDMATRLSAAELSQELLSDPGYLFLTDFSIPIPQQVFGRNNPFNIIGRD